MTRRPRGRPRHDDVLTPAEWRVVEALRHGMPVRLIAQRRGISVDAVKFHVANACGKLGLSGLGQLRRWTGIARRSPLHGRRRTMIDEQVKLGAIGQIARSVRDVDEALAFYGDVLGLPLLFRPSRDMAFFDCGGMRLYLQAGDVRSESILYFQVEDVVAAHARLVALGAACTAVPHVVHRDEAGRELWMAFFQDNDAPLVAHPHARLIALMAHVPADR
jgi:catechol 2,3-dioxygenase-like lactoylglutathione lyase family enzyme/DNA-binding CsgD family transcriptional regulator